MSEKLYIFAECRERIVCSISDEGMSVKWRRRGSRTSIKSRIIHRFGKTSGILDAANLKSFTLSFPSSFVLRLRFIKFIQQAASFFSIYLQNVMLFALSSLYCTWETILCTSDSRKCSSMYFANIDKYSTYLVFSVYSFTNTIIMQKQFFFTVETGEWTNIDYTYFYSH